MYVFCSTKIYQHSLCSTDPQYQNQESWEIDLPYYSDWISIVEGKKHL